MYWVGLALLTGYADLRQTFGYVLLILNSLVELGIASVWNGHRPGSALMVSALIMLTSAGLGCVWAWIHPTRTRT
ncbi:MAG: hypothetical protein DMF89_25785 [Acidobacteria bacterium]|nr:MAG: hypothetical protein DMF89_25785 [Acidobacteriota bacterium]